MSETKTRRMPKRQLGQYMTPPTLARQLVGKLVVAPTMRVLEPSFGDGSFLIAIVERFLPLYQGTLTERLDRIFSENIYGIEIDPKVYQECLDALLRRWGYFPQHHHLVCADFFRHTFYNDSTDKRQIAWGQPLTFDFIIGNPPFGGTIDPSLQDELDKQFGFRNGEKIKKETYAFFVVKCLDMLRPGGRLRFICSDTFMTIRTMRGLRKLLMEESSIHIERLAAFSDETSYPMVLLDLERTGRAHAISVFGQTITRDTMELTGNFSWAISDTHARYFDGSKIGDVMVCSSGMTIGKNELFLREVVEGEIIEPYDFVYFDEPITLEGELHRARLHKLSRQARVKIQMLEATGATRRSVKAVAKTQSERIRLPHTDYRYYNKANSGRFYAAPTCAVFWRDEGEAVLTFKKNGPWYLHGVGGQPFFGCCGLTWQLIASRLNVRYLPEGYILDSGAPCAFLKPEVDDSELWFILGWLNTDLCSHLLKTVINHTKNIQSKDVERLPYPFWVSVSAKEQAIDLTQTIVASMRATRTQLPHDYQPQLELLYAWHDAICQADDTLIMPGSLKPRTPRSQRGRIAQQAQLTLWHE